jgi:hypothetical protein
MGNIGESTDSDDPDDAHALPRAASTSPLKPKGTCWYCNAPVDNIRRFCNKTCADDYRSEEATFNNSDNTRD